MRPVLMDQRVAGKRVALASFIFTIITGLPATKEGMAWKKRVAAKKIIKNNFNLMILMLKRVANRKC
jgi:hypothetical protein